MNIREMIGQRLVFGFKGTELPQEFTELVRKFKLGNVILFRYNVENTAQLSRLCAEIQELVRRETGHPAFITIDQEGGMVTRLPADAVNVPGSMAIAATGRVRDAYDCAGITARQLRGIGIINVARVFGIGSVRSSVEVEMVVQLEPWDRTKNYDRTGLETEYYDILGVKVPSMLIPVMPGRNLAVILETAAINNRQKEMGYNAAQELLNRLGLQNDVSGF